MRASFQKQLALDPRKLVAAAVLAPWPRKGRAETSIDIRDISLVKIRGETLKSYFQFPDPAALRSVKSGKGGLSFLLVPGETDLPADLKKLVEDWD